MALDSPITTADLEREQQGSDKARVAVTAFFEQPVPRRRWRDILVSSSATVATVAPQSGRGLISRRPVETQRRYETLVYAEQGFPGSRALDYSFLIAPACAILEKELDELLAQPARAVAASLCEVMQGVDASQAGLLDKWAEGRSLPALGTNSLLLRALRHGLGQQQEALLTFAGGAFTPGFLDLIRTNQVAKSLDRLRNRYRNDACHGTRPFDAAAYADFSRLLVGRERAAGWEEEGPRPAPPAPEEGLLHHLLCGSRTLPEAALPPAPGPSLALRRAVDRLSALAEPRQQGLSVRVRPHHAGGDWRDVTVSAARTERPFRLRDEVCFSFQVDRDSHVTLIDVGTSGAVAVLLPNGFSPRARAEAGRVHRIPGDEFTGFVLTLDGVPGRERLVALATKQPVPVTLLPPPGQAFRSLDGPALEALTDAVRRLEGGSWGAAVCDFTIEP